jgi:ADP-ribose pyrophosphatase YjhB (NUDIX family)
MDIKIYSDGVTADDNLDVPSHTACRGIIKKNDKYLIVNLSKYDITTFPGGRLEPNETLEQCCIREVLEETGMKVKIINKVISVSEFFTDSTWTNVYFNCEMVEDTKQTTFTEEEIELGMKMEWRTLEELLDIFENNMTKHPHGPNIHNREFLGLIHSM